jgi:DNA-binding NtrC family response regulator
MRQAVLIVDDKHDMLKFLERLVRRELGVDVYTADRGEEALRIVREDGVGIVLADIRMPGMDGMELLTNVKALDYSAIVIMMTAYGSIEKAVESLKLGAYDFITKPFDEERLLHTLSNALEHSSLVRKNLDLERKIKEKEASEHFVGQSAPVKKLVETIQLVAKTDVTVLITGETGTGKELAARMTHALSNRADGPFIAVSCPAIPENILESELFGYKKGAFTGALVDRTGLFEAAGGGTLVLDEIGDISPALQTKLLRVLQEKEIKPLGDNRTYKVDVRIIASTNQDLRDKIATGQFREDLYYRLNVVSVHTPSLREIPEDIPLMANHFLSLYCSQFGSSKKRFSEDAMRTLVSRKWTGNVRELQNEVERAIIFSKGETITPGDLGCALPGLPCDEEADSTPCEFKYKEARRKILEDFNVAYITRLLRVSEGNVSLAAKEAGLERQSLQHLMKKYGISAGEFKRGANKFSTAR